MTGIPDDGRLGTLTLSGDTVLLTIREAAYVQVPSGLLALSATDGSEQWRTTDPNGGFFRVVAVGDEGGRWMPSRSRTAAWGGR